MKLITPRLIIRDPVLTDAEAIFDYAKHAQVAQYTTWLPHSSVEVTNKLLSATIAKNSKDSGDFVLELRTSGEVIGMFALRNKGDHFELGYVVNPRFQGQGFATEALQAAIAYLHSTQPQIPIKAFCDTENIASQRVMEKAGLVRQGMKSGGTVHPTLGPHPRPSYQYGLDSI